jgi:sigma-B regulation protein RsbQ
MTVVFDHVGAGDSDLSAYDKTKYSSLSGYADDVVEIGRELELKDVIFVGHSVSSMIGEFLESNHMGWSAQMAPAIMGNSDRPELGEELTNSFCRTDPEIAKAFAKVTFSSDNRYIDDEGYVGGFSAEQIDEPLLAAAVASPRRRSSARSHLSW